MKNIIEIMDELVAELKAFCADSLVKLCEAKRTADGIAWKWFDFDAEDKATTNEELDEFYKKAESYVSWTRKKGEELYAAIRDNAFTFGLEIDYLDFNRELFELKLKYKDWEFTIKILNQNAE